MPQYLKQKRGLWLFQRRIPKELRHLYGGKPMLTKSLGTSDVSVAKTMAARMVADMDEALRQTRSQRPGDKYRHFLAELEQRDSPALSDREAINLYAEMVQRGGTAAMDAIATKTVGYEGTQYGVTLLDGIELSQKRAELKGATRKVIGNRKLHAKQFLEHLCLVDIPLAEIKRSQVNAWVEAMASAGGKKGTIQLKVGTLKTIFDDAQRQHDDLTVANPFSRVDIIGKAKEGKTPFTDSELKALLAVDDDYFTRALAFSGMRGGELCALRGADIKTDEETGIMYFDITKSKTSAGIRKIPVHPSLIEWASSKAGDPGLLYQGKIKPDKPQRPTEFMNRRKERASIQCSATTHSLRGLFATGLEQAGVRSETIKRLMGHVQEDLAFSDYSKGLTLRELKEAVETLCDAGCYRAFRGGVSKEGGDNSPSPTSST
ncbi:DUF6538 domain-containing protein [uncultured Microbulbifer sp.]|uniref:DUF6538 domain-containing protein n=1 Tax=uncultured Microbulbifer sp. TaxID=348147 RepID=UPI00261A9954|nr:DUF6538 domain-containing protein [uncultured Microbulbifer sp.]